MSMGFSGGSPQNQPGSLVDPQSQDRRTWHDGDGIRVRREASKWVTRGVIEVLALGGHEVRGHPMVNFMC